MGPSGCGKSTLLRIIEGIESKDTGAIHEPPGMEGRLSAAMVFQDHSLFPWLSIYENIVYGLRLAAHKTPKDEMEERARRSCHSPTWTRLRIPYPTSSPVG